jgi:dihydroorotate dehydrogenase
MRLPIGSLRRFSTNLSRDQITARQKTLDLIQRPLSFGEQGLRTRAQDPDFFLQHHPDQEAALRIRQQMDEIALLIEKMNQREESGNRVIVLAATAFLVTSLGYTLYQLNDVNTAFTSFLPSLFTLIEFPRARKLLCWLSKIGCLPVDFGSEDPYLIRMMEPSKKHPKSRPIRVCVPVGLGAGIDIDCEGPEGFLKFGFGSIEVGPVPMSPEPELSANNIQLVGSSIFSDPNRRDGSKGFDVVAARLCDFMERRPMDLLTRNTITGLSVIVKSEEDVKKVFSHTRLLSLADFISLDVSACETPDVLRILSAAEREAEAVDSLPLLFLKVDLKQSLPPSEEMASCVSKSRTIVGVNVNGSGFAAPNSKIVPFSADRDVRVSGTMVKERSTEAVRNWFKALGEGKEIIASGGVFNGQDALEKIEAGASLVNVYSAFVVDGPPVARRIKTQLSVRLMNKGYYDLEEVIGSNHRIASKRLKEAMKRRKRF